MDADEVTKPVFPPYVAVTMLIPEDSWLPLTNSEAVAVPPEPNRDEAPSTVWPRVKETIPVGDVVPKFAATVAVSTVEALALITEDVAVTLVVVSAYSGDPAASVIVNCSGPTVKTPVRAELIGLGSTVYVKVALPAPSVGSTLNQEFAFETLQPLQVMEAEKLTVPDPPRAVKLCPVDDIE